MNCVHGTIRKPATPQSLGLVKERLPAELAAVLGGSIGASETRVRVADLARLRVEDRPRVVGEAGRAEAAEPQGAVAEVVRVGEARGRMGYAYL